MFDHHTKFVSHTVCVHVYYIGGPKNWDAGPRCFWTERACSYRTRRYCPVCVVAPNFVARGQTVGTASIKFGEAEARPLWLGVADSLSTRSCPMALVSSPYQISSLYSSNRLGVIMEIRRKILTPRVPPFKVTKGHWNRHGSIGYLWLPISVPR